MSELALLAERRACPPAPASAETTHASASPGTTPAPASAETTPAPASAETARRASASEVAINTFARRALRVLDGLALAITVARPDGSARMLATAGSARDLERLLSDRGWTPAQWSGERNLIGDPAYAAEVEHEQLGELRISHPLGDRDHSFGSLLVLCASTWPLDSRTHRMISVLAHTAALLVPAAGAPCKPVGASGRMLIASAILSDLALSANSYHELVGGVTAAVCPLIGATKGGLALWHEREFYLQMLSGSFGVPPEFVASSQAAPSDPNSPAARVVSTTTPWFSNAAVRDMWDYRDFILGFGVNKMMILPLTLHGRTIGVVHAANKPTPFNARDVRTLELITPFVAATLEHVHRRLELQRKEALALVVSRAATTIAAGQPLAGFSSSLYEFCHSVGARMVAVSFATGAQPIVVRSGEVTPAMAEQFLAAGARGGFALRTATRRPRAAGDIGWDTLHVPVLLGGRREATLSILRVPNEPYTDDERAAVIRLANVTALAWATERYQQERAQTARLRERQRIADDLHDHVAQILYSAHLTLETVLEEIRDTALRAPVGRARDLLVRSEVSIREVVSRLSSQAPADLAGRLSEIVQEVEEGFDVPIHLEVAPGRVELLESLGRPAADAILSAAREAMINAAKHAGPCRVRVELTVTARRRLHICVTDDGIGAIRGAGAGGYGLRAIRRRVATHGGTVRINRGVHGGTKVLISAPLPGQESLASAAG